MLDIRTNGGRVRVGLVGAGHWGSIHSRILSQNPNLDLAWLADSRLEQRDGSLGQPKMFAAADIAVQSEPVDLVILATPPQTHFRLCHEVLQTGSNVYCEKPLMVTAIEAQALSETLAREGGSLWVGYQYRANPAIHRLRSFVESKVLGDLVEFRSERLAFGPFTTGVGAHWDLMVHDFAIIDLILGPQALLELYRVARGAEVPSSADVDDLHVEAYVDDRIRIELRASRAHDTKFRSALLRFDEGLVRFSEESGIDHIEVYRYSKTSGSLTLTKDDTLSARSESANSLWLSLERVLQSLDPEIEPDGSSALRPVGLSEALAIERPLWHIDEQLQDSEIS